MSFPSSSRSHHYGARTASPTPNSPSLTGVFNTRQHSYNSDQFDDTHTLVSYYRETIAELDSLPGLDDASPGTQDGSSSPSTQRVKHWMLSMPIPFPPKFSNPTLESLTWSIKYASFGVGNTFFQTDIVICDRAGATKGIITNAAELQVYAYDERAAEEVKDGRRGEYGPPILNEAIATRIHSVPAFVGADISGCCSYDPNRQYIHPEIRIGDMTRSDKRSLSTGSPQLYLFFHVYENSCAKALRNIDVDVGATWSEGWSGKSPDIGKSDIREERKKLDSAKTNAELMILRLEESTRKAMEWEEKLSVMEKKVKEVEKGKARKGTLSDRDQNTRVDADNAIMKVHVGVQKFRDEVKQCREEEAERREKMETESRKRLEEVGRQRLDELEQSRKKFQDEVAKNKRMEATSKARMEAEIQSMMRAEVAKERAEWRAEFESERAERRREIERERTEWKEQMETERIEWREQMEREHLLWKEWREYMLVTREETVDGSQRSTTSRKKLTPGEALSTLGFRTKRRQPSKDTHS